jgi:hypothetical protein
MEGERGQVESTLMVRWFTYACTEGPRKEFAKSGKLAEIKAS